MEKMKVIELCVCPGLEIFKGREAVKLPAKRKEFRERINIEAIVHVVLMYRIIHEYKTIYC